jgi:hypothetical protein
LIKNKIKSSSRLFIIWDKLIYYNELETNLSQV